MSTPTTLRYTADHEWVRLDGEVLTVGITAYAADKLGEVVFAELPEAGTAVTAGAVVAEVESTKSVGEIFAPADGEVIARNEAVIENPDLINDAPYEGGWLFTLRVAGPLGEGFMDAAAYDALTAE